MSESTEYQRKWHKGPPPHVGWWNASTHRVIGIWRWWDGKTWSCPVGADAPHRQLKANSEVPENAATNQRMSWNDYWPEGARVPRINPIATDRHQ